MRNRIAACESVFVIAFHCAADRATIVIGCRHCAGRSRFQRFRFHRFCGVGVRNRIAACESVFVVAFHRTADRAAVIITCCCRAGCSRFQRFQFHRFCGIGMRNRVAARESVFVVAFHCAANVAAVIVTGCCRAGRSRFQRFRFHRFCGVAVCAGRVDRGVCRPRFPADFTNLMHYSAHTAGRLDVSNPFPGMPGCIAARKRIRVIRSNDAAIGAGVVINSGFRTGRSRFQGCGTRCFLGECVINLQRTTSRTDGSGLSVHRFQRFPGRMFTIDKRFRVLCHGRCIKTSICAVHRRYKNGAVDLSQTVETIGFPSHDCRRRRISKRVVAGHRIVDTHFIRRQIEDLAADRGHLRLHWIRYPSNYFAAINVKKVGNTSVSRTLP